MQKAIDLYNAKIATGKYNHYPADALRLLLDDCITQVIAMDDINRRRGG